MKIKTMNLIELNSIEKIETYGGCAFIDWCVNTYNTIKNWSQVL